jgi:hypothetical protein
MDSFNYNSPVQAFPLVVQASTFRNTSRHPVSKAPHAPMYFRAYDPDGQTMTDLFATTLPDSQNVRCFFGSMDTLSLRAGSAEGEDRETWPSRLCLSSKRSSEGAETCLVDEDCVSSHWDEEVSCSSTWSGCREYRDASSEGISGNVIKFDFASNLDAARASFTQHFAVTLDFPVTRHEVFGSHDELEHPLSWATSAAASMVFAVFACDPGTRNQPPVFVTGKQSTDTQVRSEYTCPPVGPCEIELYVRDFDAAEWFHRRGNSSDEAMQESRDQISIEAAVGFQRFEYDSLLQADGSPCAGFGSLQCIYRLSVDEKAGGLDSGIRYPVELDPSTREMPASARMEGDVFVRCFTAVDLHPISAAPEKQTCRSEPLCIKIRIEPIASYRGLLDKIFYPSGVTSSSPRARLDVGLDSNQVVEVHIDWNPPVGPSCLCVCINTCLEYG